MDRRPAPVTQGAGRCARRRGALVAAFLAALAGPALAQTGQRGIGTQPPAGGGAAAPAVRVIEWVNQSFAVPDSIGVFETPDASRDPVTRLRVGSSIEVLGILEGQTWLQVRLPEGTIGYVVATAIPGALRPRPATVAPPPEQQVVAGPALVHDTGTLLVQGRVVFLAHIQGIGGEAATGLQAFIRGAGGTVTCRPVDGGLGCVLADNTDVGLAAVVNGAAGLKPGAPASYRAQAEEARRNRRGLWARVEPEGSVEDQMALILPATVPASAPPPAFQSARVAEGLAYLSGQPFAFQEGELAALVFVPGIGWGYWDRRLIWRAAPATWITQLERRNPGGNGLREVDIRRFGIPVMPRGPRTPAGMAGR